MPDGMFVIALDGPAASGKSTVGHGVARALGLRYFDTGLLYRALTWLASARGVQPSDVEALSTLARTLDIEVDAAGDVWHAGCDITARLTAPEVDTSVSTVAAHAAVRTALVPVQRALLSPPGVVLAGRDIGTVIAPDAELKIWLTASAEERARRRAAQTGDDATAVLARMRERDATDAGRAAAPMTRAADALEVNTDGLDVEHVIARIVALAQGAMSAPSARAPR